MLKLKLQYFGHLMRRVDSLEKTDARRDWVQEEKWTTEDEMAGWHHRLDGHEFEWTLGVSDGRGSLACCNSWGSQGKNTEVVCHSLLQWTSFCQTFLPWPARLGWPHRAWLSFIELDKAVVRVIRLPSFLWLWFQCVCSLMPSRNTYHLTWVSLTLDVGYLFHMIQQFYFWIHT